MRVLMVIERYFPVWGGAENQLRQIIPHLTHLGCEVEVATRRWKMQMSPYEQIDGVAVHRLGLPGKSHLKTFLFTISLVFYLIYVGSKFEVIHTHGAVALGAMGALVAKILGVKNIAKIATAGRIIKLKKKLSGRILLALFNQSNSIICMSDEIRKELELINTPAKIIYRITNAVDVERFRPFPEAQRKAWRMQRKFLPNTPVVIFAGRLVPRKGFDILLKAWEQVVKLDSQAQLIVLGSGNYQPDSIESEVRIKVANEGIGNVHFEGETVSPESYLGVADIFVFPSRKEGFPNALMEAMAAALATVSSRIGGVVELVDDGKTGLLFSPEDSRVLADNIIFLLNNPKTRSEIGSRARKYVAEHYTFDRIARRVNEVYRTIIDKKT